MMHSIYSNDETPILQLGPDFYDPVQPAVFPQKKLRYWNSSLSLTIEKDRLFDFQHLEKNIPQPLALRYHGHQFQHYNPDLGDGRGFLYAQIKQNNQWYDLGTKGSGQTPYSRSGDGRLTLKGAVREALATEMLESLGVKTSRTAAIFETGENLNRNDEPSPTRSAVLTRFSLGHIRIGTFQRLAYFKQIENIKKLTSYCLFFYFQEKNSDPDLFFSKVVKANADLVASVMMAGFIHGVLNTDNINISGELFDYGPYRFMPEYNSDFIAAYFDREGLYRYSMQPTVFMWNLHQLGQSLKVAYPEMNTEKELDAFQNYFNQSLQKYFLKRLNLKEKTEEENFELIKIFFTYMETEKKLFEQTFFDSHSKRRLPERIKEGFAAFEISDQKLIGHPYFAQTKPVTLLIDEIETIWQAIDEKDDWSLFENKLQSIRQIRGIY